MSLTICCTEESILTSVVDVSSAPGYRIRRPMSLATFKSQKVASTGFPSRLSFFRASRKAKSSNRDRHASQDTRYFPSMV